MRIELLGVGTATPSLNITRSESVDAARTLCAEDDDHGEVLQSLYRQSGIESRQVVYKAEEFRRIVYGEGEYDTPFVRKGSDDPGPSTAERMVRFEAEALPLALESSRIALERSGVAPGSITHLVTVSCTGLAAPGVDLGLMKGLGLAATVERTHVGFMGCHGSLNGLRVARGLIAAEPDARVLLSSVELCSLHYSYGWNPKRMVGNALFADGAGAVVLAAAPEGEADRDAWRLAANGACLFPNSEQAMSWMVRDHGFEMVLSTRVPGLIQQNIRPWLESWLGRFDLAVGDVASWAVHPGGPRVLTSVEEALGLTPGATDASRSVLLNHGNMSSATVLFILDEMMRRVAPRPCVALGFGPGLAAEAALFV
ncbi:type III polyketide synthase [Paludisphaera mucosa]|uniref:Type III polyketide synthase n=1 Tax=Paludisphaera mucosa TaxID=3030827 RepID=A0ABT6F4N3_9BACT|nr:type III polyketide synthase [Paludisphaera mucosa]MDG3002374.1 type III polyketide synthase [Paludisphaera mucosa]